MLTFKLSLTRLFSTLANIRDSKLPSVEIGGGGEGERGGGGQATTNYPSLLHPSPGSGKRHLLHLGRPQDRSGSPTKGAGEPATNHQLMTN
ncbi:MAG: hypothetical protein ACHBN1_08140 [Heteroscytonema crispum UTEX LB 1556]